MSGLNFKTPCFAYRGGRNVPFCFTVVFAIVLHRFRSRSIPLNMSPFQRCIFSEFFLSEVLSASLGKQIDGCARSAEIMVKKGGRRHIWYDVGIPCQI